MKNWKLHLDFFVSINLGRNYTFLLLNNFSNQSYDAVQDCKFHVIV